jgi:peptide/nickel transport system permease protein
MNNSLRVLMQFIVACVGIIFIGAIPSLFQVQREFEVEGEPATGPLFNFSGYFEGVKELLGNIANISEITYNASGTIRPVFPKIFEPYLYSAQILLGALLIGVVSAIVLTYITMLLHRKIISSFKFITFVLESLPDILVIVGVQAIIIYIFQKTGVRLFSIAVYKENIYVLPILCLAVLPAIQFYKILLLIFEEELEEHYVELAKGKGLKKSWILLVHVLRNAGISMFYHSKAILWFMLSNLVILEYFFNLYGITAFLLDYITSEIFTVGLFMIFLPLFFIYTIGEFLIQKLTKREATNL